MQDNTVAYSFEPSRLIADGGRAFEAVAISLEIGDEAARVVTRDGTLSDDKLVVPYDDVVDVEATRNTTYSLSIETDSDRYEITNVTPDHGQVEYVLSYIRDRIETEQQTTTEQQTASAEQAAAEQQTASAEPTTKNQRSESDTSSGEAESDELDEWVWGGTGSDESNDERVGPGERFTCPECGEPIELPDTLPQQQRSVNCPNCDSTIGQTPAEEAVVVVQH